MSEHQALGLSIHVYQPTFGVSYNPKAGNLGAFKWDTYEHTLAVGIGFDSMTCVRATSWEDAYWWLSNGLAGHVEVRDDTNTVVWEGRVNKVSLTAGGLSWSRGPLLDVANRCVVTYQLLDTSSNEGQEQKRTDPGNNLDSQAKYGICYQVLAAGTRTTANANQIRDSYALVNAWPRMPKDLALGGGGAGISLECLGYAHWLNYPYRLASVTGTVTVSAKIAAVLAADPNAFFGGVNQIATNALTVQQLEDQDRGAGEIIADLVSLGDVAFTRYLFGVWAQRSARYEAAPTVVEYQQRTDDARQVVEDMGSNVVNPWAVLPGKWLTFTTLMPGALSGLTMTGMPESERSMFIERVKYTAPYGLQLGGGEVNTLKQQLAQWGLGGL